MTDDLIEAGAKALAISWFGSGIDEWAVAEVRPDVIAVIRAVAPMILDMAADVVDDAEYAGFVRQLKERF